MITSLQRNEQGREECPVGMHMYVTNITSHTLFPDLASKAILWSKNKYS